MIGTIVFVTAFVVLGLATIAVAMSKGPGGRPRIDGSSRRASRATYAAIAAVAIGGGIAVPAIVLATAGPGSRERAPGGIRLTSAEAEGRQVFAARCATCHALNAANAVGRVGPDLDELRPPRELTLDAIAKGRARGMGQMPAGLADGEEAENVADFIVKTAGR